MDNYDDEVVCPTISKNTIFSVNIVVHMLILFTFLTLFFMFYVSKIASNAFEKEFDILIGKNVLKYLQENDDGQIKYALQSSTSMNALDTFEKWYSQSSKDVETHNTWMRRMSYTIIGFVIISIALAIGLLYFSCGQKVPIGTILYENVIIFTFIGIAEYLFFTNIAMKFIPAPPSLLVKSVIDAFKRELTK